jgi:hypothetical protein
MTDMPLSFAKLPLFATDAEISTAIVGKAKAEKWRQERLPTLATKPGFPPIDAFHGGRPVPLVWKFYQHYLSIAPQYDRSFGHAGSVREGE